MNKQYFDINRIVKIDLVGIATKARLTIHLEHDNMLTINFETDDEMQDYVDMLLSMSKAAFEMVDYEKQ